MLSPHRKPHDYATQSDDQLVVLARGGDATAYGELWRRHSGIGTSIARRFYEIADADDLVSEAFARILSTIQRGGGPNSGFRPYLITTIGNVARRWATRSREGASDELDLLEDPKTVDDPVVASTEREFALEAFRSLPERWQAVLWYGAVEGMGPTEIGRYLGMSANAASVLSNRARAGLRTAWIQAHLNDATLSEECRWTSGRLGRRATGSLSARELAKVREHLSTCLACRARAKELDQLSSKLAVLLVPALLGLGLTSLDSDDAATAAVLPLTKATGSMLTPTHVLLAGIAAIVVTTAAIITSSTAPESVVAIADPRPIASPAPESSSRNSGENDSADSENDATEPLNTLSEPAPAPPAGASTDDSVPPAPLPMLTAPAITSFFNVYTVRPPTVAGTGIPGATVVIADELGSTVATVLADAVGSWSSGELASLSPAADALVIYQTDSSGRSSPAQTVPIAALPLILSTMPNGAVGANAAFELVVVGWAGGTVQVSFSPDTTPDFPGHPAADSTYPSFTVDLDLDGLGSVIIDSSISGGHRADFRYVDDSRTSSGVSSYNFVVDPPV